MLDNQKMMEDDLEDDGRRWKMMEDDQDVSGEVRIGHSAQSVSH